jgi:hypothetical protein
MNSVAIAQLIPTMADGSPEKVVLLQAFETSLRAVWITSVPFTFAAMLCNFFIKDINLDRLLKTEQGAQKEVKRSPDEEPEL